MRLHFVFLLVSKPGEEKKKMEMIKASFTWDYDTTDFANCNFNDRKDSPSFLVDVAQKGCVGTLKMKLVVWPMGCDQTATDKIGVGVGYEDGPCPISWKGCITLRKRDTLGATTGTIWNGDTADKSVPPALTRGIDGLSDCFPLFSPLCTIFHA